MRRTNQGGSILSFILIGGVMILLLVGGAYGIRHMLAPKASESTPVAQKDDKPSSDSTPKQEQSKPESDTSNNTTTPKTDQKSDTAPQNQTETSPTPTPGEHTLPSTGPSDALLSGTFLSILVASVAMYVRSRRELASL